MKSFRINQVRKGFIVQELDGASCVSETWAFSTVEEVTGLLQEQFPAYEGITTKDFIEGLPQQEEVA